MATVTPDFPDGAFSSLRRSPKEFARALWPAAAIPRYGRVEVSQGTAAEITGLGRTDFRLAPAQTRVEAIQVVAEDLSQAGFWVSEPVRNIAMSQAGEHASDP